MRVRVLREARLRYAFPALASLTGLDLKVVAESNPPPTVRQDATHYSPPESGARSALGCRAGSKKGGYLVTRFCAPRRKVGDGIEP